MIFSKISLGLFFLRILVERWQKRILYGIIGLSTAVGIGYFFYAVFACGNPDSGERYWERKIAHQCTGGSLALVDGIGFTHGIVMALTDITLASLPIPVIRRSKMARREKMVIYGILVLAALYFSTHLVKAQLIHGVEDASLRYLESIGFQRLGILA
jgi:hypothetical protein